jgi:hypothetical protein
MTLPRNCKSETNLLAFSSNTSIVTHMIYTNPSMPPNGTTNSNLERPIPHDLSSEAIIAIALGRCVIVSTWLNHFWKKHVNGMLSKTQLSWNV